MVRVCVMLRVLPSQSSVRSLLVLLLYKQRCLSCLARPVRGTISRNAVFSKTTCTGTKIKNFFIVVLIPKPFFKFPDKLIGKGCPITGVRIASLHLAETLRPTAMTARSTSRSRASCCCPCGLAPVVTVAAGTRWGGRHSVLCFSPHDAGTAVRAGA